MLWRIPWPVFSDLGANSFTEHLLGPSAARSRGYLSHLLVTSPRTGLRDYFIQVQKRQ